MGWFTNGSMADKSETYISITMGSNKGSTKLYKPPITYDELAVFV